MNTEQRPALIEENTPRLETERLVLRRFTEADTAAMFEILRDPQVNVFLPWFPAESLEEAAAFLSVRYLERYAEPSGYYYAVCLKEDGRLVGYVKVEGQGAHDFGYGLHRDFWGRGLITEAGQAIIDRLRKCGFPYITATHDVHNPRSGAVMKRLGMAYRYSYEEQWQPKDIRVIFRMYQLNFTVPQDYVYPEYWEKYPVHFIEEQV